MLQAEHFATQAALAWAAPAHLAASLGSCCCQSVGPSHSLPAQCTQHHTPPAPPQFLSPDLMSAAERKALRLREVVREFERFPGDTGSTEVQGELRKCRRPCSTLLPAVRG